MTRTDIIAAIEAKFTTITERQQRGADTTMMVRNDDASVCIEVHGDEHECTISTVVWSHGYGKVLYSGGCLATAFASVEKFDWKRWGGMYGNLYPRMNGPRSRVDWLAA